MKFQKEKNNIKRGAKGYWFVIHSFLLVLSMINYTGCSAAKDTSKEEKELVWPLPPEQPRIKYLRSLSDRKSIEGSQSKILESLLGEEKSDALQKPYGVIAAEDKVYITESTGGRVFIFDLKNSKLSFISGSLTMPIGIAADSAGNVYISDVIQKAVLVFNPKGEMILSFGSEGGMENPAGIAADNTRKRIYVVDSKAHKVKVYSLNGKFLFEFGKRGIEDGEFNFPTNIALDKEGKIYVVDTINARVEVFDAEGKYLWKFGSLGDSFGQFTRPKGIAVDSRGNIYVVDAAFNNFQIFNNEGKLLMHVGSFGTEPGNFWLPTGISVDNQDRIYVVDATNKRVQVFQLIKYNNE
ncbi:MAG: 6-bladed beta-propeller [Ignavibacteria bacterium]|nr:6-bladed beta-propeller [Ignavibacteria bacterium]